MNIMQMMKQAQELQAKAKQMQEELAETRVEGSSGGGLVQVTLSGRGEMKGLKVDPSLMVAAEAEILEDLIVAAHEDARSRVERLSEEKMKSLAGGLPIPPGLKLF